MDLTTQLQEVLAERATLSGEMRNILEVSGSKGLSADAQKQWNELEGRFQGLNAQKDALEAQIANEREMAGGTATATANGIEPGANGEARAQLRQYEEVFSDQYLRNGGHLGAALTSENRSVLADHNAGRDRRDMVIGTPSGGGYFVPPTWENKFLEGLIFYSAIRKTRVTVLQTGDGREINYPVVLNRGDAQFIDENTDLDEVDDELGVAQLRSYAVGRLTLVSKELMTDTAFDIDAFLRTSLERKIGLAEDAKFVKGSGVNEPQGLLTGATGVDVSAAADISFDDILTVIYSLTDPYLANAEMLVHSSTVPKLLGVKDGQGRYLWQPSLAAGRPDTIWGFNFFTDPFIDPVGANKNSMLFGDFALGGILRQVNGVEVQRLVERYAEKRMVGFLGDHRVDSKVVDENALVKSVHPAA